MNDWKVWSSSIVATLIVVQICSYQEPIQARIDPKHRIKAVRYVKFGIETHGSLTRERLKSKGYDITSLAKNSGREFRSLVPMSQSSTKLDEGGLRLYVEFEDGYSYWVDNDGNFDDGTVCGSLGRHFEHLKFTLFELIPPRPSLSKSHSEVMN